MATCLRGLVWGWLILVLLACSSTPIAQIAPIETMSPTQLLHSIATYAGTRVSVAPSATTSPTITVTSTATDFTGVIPTLASESPTPTMTETSIYTPTASPTNEPVILFAESNSAEHTVLAGETLTIIAGQYGVTVNQLLSVNDLTRDQVLLVGRRLTIPLPTPTITPSPTIDINNRGAVAQQAILAFAPTRLPNQVNDVPYDEFLLMDDAVIANIRDIYENGQALGRDSHAFTRIGDSTIEPPHFFSRFDEGEYHLGDYSYLQRTIDYYSGSFAHDSVSVIRGLHTWSVFDSMWSPASCDVGEHMLACEFRMQNPSMIFIRLGTNNRGSADMTRENFEAIVTYCIDNGVIPILGTKADRFDGDSNSVNNIIREVAEDYDVPLWDFDLLASTLANHGLTADDVHLSYFYANDWRLARGFTTGHGLHNLTGLIVLDELSQVLRDE